MIDKDYEAKKRECWENFKFARRPLNTDKKVFDYIFDRAYALGREKETITQEEIEKAAVEYAASLSECGMYDKETPATKEDIEYAFKAGVKFALGKQEKDAEPPKFKKGDRVKTKYNDEYTISAVEPITDKYMYSLVCDNKTWCGMHLESKLRKVDNK